MFQAIREFRFDFRHDYLTTVALSYIFFTLVYRYIAPYLSYKFSKSYAKLSSNHKIEWNVRFTSTLFSLTISTLCLYVLFIDKAITISPLMLVEILVFSFALLCYIISNINLISNCIGMTPSW
jgi:hypothetical protein